MGTAQSDGGDTLTPDDVTDQISMALRILQAIATTGDDRLDAQLLTAEKALRDVIIKK